MSFEPAIWKKVRAYQRSTGEVKIKQGSLCGYLLGTSNGKSVNAYLGNLFAESTAGQNGWKTTLPRAAWEGTFEATRL